MRKIFIVAGILFLLQSFIEPHHKSSDTKLIVLIAIDGLRGDLLSKYKPAFKYGFKRLFDQGYEFKNAWVDHAITVSHAGHVTLATGNYPNHHGIVDAAFYQRKDDSLEFTDAFADPDYTLVGLPGKSISTKKVLTSGLAEWVKKKDLSANVLCVGTGNISSALYCFHPNENVFWYSDELGKYVSSTYFVNSYPDWINSFNRDSLPKYFSMSAHWENIVPGQYLKLCNSDSAQFENYGEQHTFPYVASENVVKKNLWNYWIRNTPYSDNATLALAKNGISSLSLGQKNTTDYLSVVLSQVDDMSHVFGPSSLEVFNTLMQMDAALGNFFSYLDQKVGKNNYVLALSADHGFAEIPEQISLKGVWSRRIKEAEIEKIMNEADSIKNKYRGRGNSFVVQEVKKYLSQFDFIADIYTPDQLNEKNRSNDPYLELYKKSHREDRIPRLPFFSLQSFRSVIAETGIMIRLKENAMIDLDCVIHGSPYDYDRFVPMFFMGANISTGSSMKKVKTIDVVPTLARLANLKTQGMDGKVLF